MVSDIISKEELYKIRKKKILDEIQAAKRILDKNVEPIEVADKFMHNSFKLLRDGILNRDSELTEEEIKKKVIEIFDFRRRLKTFKKQGEHTG